MSFMVGSSFVLSGTTTLFDGQVGDPDSDAGRPALAGWRCSDESGSKSGLEEPKVALARDRSK